MFHTTVKSQENEDISILIQLDNHSYNYLCDCGDASDLTVKECQDIAAIFISHTHIDHFVNFDFVLRHQLGIQRKVVICGPQGITEQVQARIKSYQWNLIEEDSISYEIREIVSEDHIQVSLIQPPRWEIKPLDTLGGKSLFESERFNVQFTILDHKTPSIAYLFRERDTVNIDLKGSEFRGGRWIKELKEAFAKGEGNLEIQVGEESYVAKDLFHLLSVKKGDSVGIIMDHAANSQNHRKIKALFEGGHKVLIEAYYKSEDKEFAALNFHSYSLESAKIMKECRVGEAIPVHFSRKYRAEQIAELKAEFFAELQGAVRAE